MRELDRFQELLDRLGGFVRRGTTMSPNEHRELMERLRDLKVDIAVLLARKCERIEELTYELTEARKRG